MHISTKQLRAFMALYKQRNFTRAASSVHLSQPAFSGLITALETETNLRLFNRDKRSVSLTPDGEAFLKIAERLIRQYEESIKQIEAHARGEKGNVGIAALPSATVCWISPALSIYWQRYPKVRVELFDVVSDQGMQLTSEGIVDFGLTAGGTDLDDLESKPLYSERMFVACPAKHPLAQLPTVRVEDLKGHRFIHFAKGTSIRQFIEGKLPIGNIQNTIEVQQLTTMMGLISAGQGVSVIPELALYQFQHRDIVVKPLTECSLKREIHLVTRKGHALSIAAQNFLDILLACINESRNTEL